MVFFFGYQPEKLQASMYLLIYTVFSSLPLLLLFLRLGGYILFFPQGVGFWFVLFITLGFIVKTPMYLVSGVDRSSRGLTRLDRNTPESTDL